MSKSNSSKSNSSKSPNILILMSGSIAAYKVCYLISQLKQKNYNVKVAMSKAVTQFIGPSTIEGLLGEPPSTDMYESGSVMDHIHLVRWADLVLVAPATANTINKFSAGLGDDLISTLFLAFDFNAPFLIAPAMNTKMYFHPATQSSLKKLQSMGCTILEAASGILACGELGYGKLLDPELIIQEVEKMLLSGKTSDKRTQIESVAVTKPLKILITGGGTSEPIDHVRSITNSSTGKTAARIADHFIESGCEVIGFFASKAVKPLLKCELKTFVTSLDLETLLNSYLKNNFDMIVHAAAVSDYSLLNPSSSKISSDADFLELKLKKNKKLINQIKVQNPTAKLIGFKLTSGLIKTESDQKIQQLFFASGCDFVVHNDWVKISDGKHEFNLHSKQTHIEHLSIDDLCIELFNLTQSDGIAIDS